MDFRSSLRFLFILIFLLLGFKNAEATHMIGGDVTYNCLGNNRFEITLTLFQDCLKGEPLAIEQDNPARYAIYSRNAVPALVSAGEVTAQFAKIVDPNFSNSCIDNYPQTCLRQQQFVFVVTLAPSADGYYIVYQRCCRNASIENITNPGNVGVTYLATIPPFSNNECPNNSAVFKTLPPQIICVNNPFVYDFSATDADGDSLSYTLCEAHPGGSPSNPIPTGNQISPPPYPSVTYVPPYTAQQPVQGVPPITIDPVTGLMSGTPSLTGRFIVTVCAHEWRDGVIINTVSRDVQFIITDCSKKVSASIPELADFPNTFAVSCDGYTVSFKNTSKGADSYLWNFGVPGASSTQFEPIFTYPDTGTYEVKLIVNPGSTCSDSITRLVKIYPFFNVGFKYSGNLCPDEDIHFTDTSFTSFPPIVSWEWDFGDSTPVSRVQNPVHSYRNAGGPQTVKLIAKSKLGCVDSAFVTVPLGSIDVFAGNDTVIVKDAFFKLRGSGGQYYEWSPGMYLSDPNIANPEVKFPGTGRYTFILKGFNDKGCEQYDTVTIIVVDKGAIFIPSAFSPNGDGLNDVLRPQIVGYSLIEKFRIFNRYGQQVFISTSDNKPGWNGTFNGKPCDAGVYFWEVTAVNAKGEKENLKGDITLIR